VSKTPTCRSPGKSFCAIRIPTRFGGLWSGPRGMHSSTIAMTSGVIAIEPANFEPPWTTRCPTARRPSARPTSRRTSTMPCSASSCSAPGIGFDVFVPFRLTSREASGEPSRWAMPDTCSTEVSGSMTANLRDEDPQLRTSTFMPFFPCRAVQGDDAGEPSPPRSSEQWSGVSFWI
jgi:hypothetical protein